MEEGNNNQGISEPKNILIIEDDDTLRKILAIELKRKGYNVIEYRDSALAINAIEKEKPRIDAAIIDLMNLGYGGNSGDVMRKYPEYRATMIIYYSALTENQFNKKILNLPNTYFIHKVPGSIKQVISKITGKAEE